MQVVLVILSVGLLGLIIYFAVSSRSSRLVRISAFVALGLICLSLVVSGIFLIKGPGESTDIVPLPVFQDAQPPVKASNTLAIVVIFVIFLFIVALIIYLAIRQQRKKEIKVKIGENPAEVFSVADELEFEDQDKEDEEESFDIEL